MRVCVCLFLGGGGGGGLGVYIVRACALVCVRDCMCVRVCSCVDFSRAHAWLCNSHNA